MGEIYGHGILYDAETGAMIVEGEFRNGVLLSVEEMKEEETT